MLVGEDWVPYFVISLPDQLNHKNNANPQIIRKLIYQYKWRGSNNEALPYQLKKH